MRRFIAVLIAAFAVTGTAVAGFSAAGVVGSKSTHAVADTTIDVKAYEYNFTLSASTAPAGIVNFVVHNTGTDDHDFAIATPSGLQKTPTLHPGDSATLTVNFTKAGSYNYACTIGEHASFGMQGTFTVTGSTTTTTTGATTTNRTTTTTATTTPPPPVTVPVREDEFHIYLPSTKKKVAYFKKVKVYVKVKGKRVPKKVHGKFVYKKVKRFRIVTVNKTVKAGMIHFVITNDGKIPHNFVIGSGQSLVIASGKSTTLDVDLTPGKYRYECSITGHAALGMKGTLVVV